MFKRRSEEARNVFKNIASASFSTTKILKLERNLSLSDDANRPTIDTVTSGDDDEPTIEALEVDESPIEDEIDETMTYEEQTFDSCNDSKMCDIKSSENSNVSTKRRRRGSLNPKLWVRNKRKHAKNAGQSYVASNGKCVEAKQMKSNCGEQCRMKCSSKLTEIERQKLFDNFYALADIEKQRKYLFDLIRSYEPKKIKLHQQKSRSIQRKYFLKALKSSTENETLTDEIQVCRLMFLNTFAVSSQTIDTIFKKSQSENKFSDIRGKFKRKFCNPSPLDEEK